MRFDEHQLQAIDRALCVAADVYDGDALNMDSADQPRLAEQFRSQANEARALSEKITHEVY